MSSCNVLVGDLPNFNTPRSGSFPGSIKEKLEYADYDIDNSGSKVRTIEQARALYNELEGLKNIKKGT